MTAMVPLECICRTEGNGAVLEILRRFSRLLPLWNAYIRLLHLKLGSASGMALSWCKGKDHGVHIKMFTVLQNEL